MESAYATPKPSNGSRLPHLDESVDQDAVLTALNDENCRRLLESTADDALTASELIDRCNIPKSTVYRKLDLLTDSGLLEERVRISTNGAHASEYRQAFEDITITVTDPDGLSVGVSTG